MNRYRISSNEIASNSSEGRFSQAGISMAVGRRRGDYQSGVRAMIRSEEILKNVRVASPCPMSWDRMEGDDRVRYCGNCKLNVYNLSDMDREDAARLVSEKEGRLCVTFYQRRDGSVLTRDCPVGLRAARKKMAMALAVCFAMFLSVFAWGAKPDEHATGDDTSALVRLKTRVHQIEPFKTVLDWIYPARVMGGPPPITGRTVGVMAAPPAQTPRQTPKGG
jgi:hypothetical protein